MADPPPYEIVRERPDPDKAWKQLASVMNTPPDQAGILREGDTIMIRYNFGRLTQEKFQEIGDHLVATFPYNKFMLIEADEFSSDNAGNVRHPGRSHG